MCYIDHIQLYDIDIKYDIEISYDIYIYIYMLYMISIGCI